MREIKIRAKPDKASKTNTDYTDYADYFSEHELTRIIHEFIVK